MWGNKIPGTHKQTKTRDVAEYAKKNNYDGVIFKQIADRGGYQGYQSLNHMTDADFLYENMHIGEDSFNATNKLKSDIFIAFNSNQIKSATDNVGTFSRTNDRIDYYEGESTLGVSYNGESKEQLQNKIDSRIKSLEKERANLNNVLSLMDIAKEDFKNLPLERKVGALRRKAASFNKEYNTSIRVDNSGNIIHNMKEIDNNLSKLKDSTLADNIIKQWHTEQAFLRQEEINRDLELLKPVERKVVFKRTENTNRYWEEEDYIEQIRKQNNEYLKHQEVKKDEC